MMGVPLTSQKMHWPQHSMLVRSKPFVVFIRFFCLELSRILLFLYISCLVCSVSLDTFSYFLETNIDD